jgi:hypothetical protein
MLAGNSGEHLPGREAAKMTATGIELMPAPQPRRSARRTRATVAPEPRKKRNITVRIWPFGLLATQVTERPLVLHLPADASTGDAIAAMSDRYGRAFVRQLTPERGELARCCRLFVNGEPVEDLSVTLSAGGGAVDVEIILIMGYEGG